MSEPATSAERRARELIVGPQEGLYLVLGGGDHLKGAASKLKTVVQEAPDAAQTAAVRLALGTAALNPTIDPKTGVQSQPRLDEAKKHLDATLDSRLPAVSVVKAQTELAEALEKKGRTAEAKRVRTETVQKMQRHESAKEYIDEIKRPSKTPQKPPGKPPGEHQP
jgi:methylthioribose-1-phosphate isomerase